MCVEKGHSDLEKIFRALVVTLPSFVQVQNQPVVAQMAGGPLDDHGVFPPGFGLKAKLAGIANAPFKEEDGLSLIHISS